MNAYVTSYVQALWEKYSSDLSEDFRFHRTRLHATPRRPNEPIPQPFASDVNAALHALADIFQALRRSYVISVSLSLLPALMIPTKATQHQWHVNWPMIRKTSSVVWMKT